MGRTGSGAGRKMTQEHFMLEALKEARKGGAKGEVPVGAVIVLHGKIIARAHSLVRGRKDPTAHAEILAIRKASAKNKYERLNGADMYVTLEPCAMCAGAMVLSRIERLYFGASEPNTGAAGSVFNIVSDPHHNHRIMAVKGMLEAESSVLLKSFFKDKRKK